MKTDIEFIDYEEKESKVNLNKKVNKLRQDLYYKMVTIHLIGMIQGMLIISFIVLYEVGLVGIAMVAVVLAFLLTPPVRLFKRK